MHLGTARTAVAVASTAGLLLSGAASASDERRVWVDRDEYKKVTFYYDAKKKDKDDDHYSRAA